MVPFFCIILNKSGHWLNMSVWCRAGTCSAVSWYPQLPIQAWFTTRPAINISGETWLGPVLLQGGTSRAKWPDTQKSTSVYCHESYRPQLRASNSCSESHTSWQFLYVVNNCYSYSLIYIHIKHQQLIHCKVLGTLYLTIGKNCRHSGEK